MGFAPKLTIRIIKEKYCQNCTFENTKLFSHYCWRNVVFSKPHCREIRTKRGRTIKISSRESENHKPYFELSCFWIPSLTMSQIGSDRKREHQGRGKH